MTILGGIEIDDINYQDNEIKNSIQNNDKIEDNLHIIMVISNPCQYARRYILAREFVLRIENEKNVILYIVELVYGNKQQFRVTNNRNKKHLQIRTDTSPLWHKENMINIGVEKLLPNNWKAFAWIDADIEFENAEWATDALKILNGSRDIIQLFSHAIDMDLNEDAMNIFASFGFQYTKKRPYNKNNINKMWHPGFAWACTKKAYQKMGGLYQMSILGAGDHNMALSLIGNGDISVNENVNDNYLQSILDFQKQIKGLRLGYTPGIIRHYFHGTKKNRRYAERWQILVNNKYSPKLHITQNKDGLLVPTKDCPQKMLDEIYDYFKQRNEDEGLLERIKELNISKNC